MDILQFDKKELGNLEYSLMREMLCTDRTGDYMSTTIIGCNTRKYHGLMVCPVEEQGEGNFVLLSTLDETVVQHNQAFNLAIHRFPGVYEPRGHKYIIDFSYTPNPSITYRVGGVILKKEYLWVHSHAHLMIRYTLIEAKSDTKLRLRPFLAFRNSHTLSKANMFADAHSTPVKNGVKNRLYEGFPYLYMQTNCKSEFVIAPDWYNDFEYIEELQRGYPAHEDLLTTGYFEADIKKGQSIIFSCSLKETDPKKLTKIYEDELAKRSDKDSLKACLLHAARQFIVRRGGKTEVIAGYPWFGSWGRDTFIALPGITLSRKDVDSCVEVIDTMTKSMKGGLFPNMGTAYNSVDAPMWFFWTLQQLAKHQSNAEVWQKYGNNMKDILNSFRAGSQTVRVDDNGLVWAECDTHAMTWMDAMVDGKPVTGREGYQVEVNALWYNAVCYTLKLAKAAKDKEFVDSWKDMPELIKNSFISKFWVNEQGGYLADYVDYSGANTFIRPNQIIACSLENTMLDQIQAMSVIGVVRQHLLTPMGLRTLSPRNSLYKGRCVGDQRTRDLAYHQGTVWPWLLEHYVAANFNIAGKSYVDEAAHIVSAFERTISTYGLGSIAEIYDGDPPYTHRGAISQAWSVAALLRIMEMIDKYKRMRTK